MLCSFDTLRKSHDKDAVDEKKPKHVSFDHFVNHQHERTHKADSSTNTRYSCNIQDRFLLTKILMFSFSYNLSVVFWNNLTLKISFISQ